jgi:hypothetical protein
VNNDITSAWADFITSWHEQHGNAPVTLAQVASLPGAQQWMENSGTRQELGANISNHAALHPTLRPVRLRGRYAYMTKAGRVRKPALWRIEVVEQEVAS